MPHTFFMQLGVHQPAANAFGPHAAGRGLSAVGHRCFELNPVASGDGLRHHGAVNHQMRSTRRRGPS